MQSQQQMLNALTTGFINHTAVSHEQLQPKLISNDHDEEVLPTILHELRQCRHFKISVAFITTGGLTMLKAVLADLHTKGIKGQLLTSTYLSFNHPQVFKQLLKIPNIEVRLTEEEGFHAKGYIFEQQSYETLIIGSSNLTVAALKTNYEWNVKLSSLSEGLLLQRFHEQFDYVFARSTPLTEQWITQYTLTYQAIKREQVLPFAQMPSAVVDSQLEAHPYVTPNDMQRKALEQIAAIRTEGAKRALVISATGTGKTYLSAFDVLNVKPKKMLFIVHREQILKKAMADYRKILGGDAADYGLFVGRARHRQARYLFATIQTLSKPENLASFDRDEFDYILIDEVHRAGAETYTRVINYFTPQFMLGMTATPERTDDFNIFELFDYNIAYEIRLQEALKENMLCPFHYFGVTDYETDDYAVAENLSLDKLLLEERVQHIIDKVNYYGYSGDCVKGLMFCSRKEEAYALSAKLNAHGLRTAALTGDDEMETREKTIEQLEKGMLDYILTVDIFNEGIDIPVVNQIVMLRQTESSIIFIQQLGRGLRKHDAKDYVVILDFIGNYKNNYMIPMALSGDQTYNKDNLRKNTLEPTYIKGLSSVHFEEIAKERIFEAINQKTLVTIRKMKESYIQLKNRLNRIPYLYDFIEHHMIAPSVILEKKPNYDMFLEYVEKEHITLSASQSRMLTMLSQELINGKRLHEIVLINMLIERASVTKADFIAELTARQLAADAETISSVERILTLTFFVSQRRDKYAGSEIVTIIDDTYHRTSQFTDALQNERFKRYVEDICQCATAQASRYTQPLVVGEKYGRLDYCRLMNWPQDMTSTIYGYKINEETKTCPLFITYKKDEKLSAATLYEDELLNAATLKWYTRPDNTLMSKDVKKLLAGDLRIDVFVKKQDAEGKDYFYLGQATPIVESAIEQKNGGKNRDKSIVCINFALETPVDETIYRYLTE